MKCLKVGEITMAKDDYHVIIYQILAYLYQCLKKGVPVEGKNLNYDSRFINVNPDYWKFIMIHLMNSGYIEGITVTKTWGQDTILSDLEQCRITPEGIEYLTDNAFMGKVRSFLQNTATAADISVKLAPFVLDEIMKRM